MFSAFLFHSLLCGCVTLVYFILRKLVKVSPTIRYACDCILFLYYAFPTMLLPVNKVTGRVAQILEREDVISLSLLPEGTGNTAALNAEFAKFNLPVLMKVWCAVLVCLLVYICFQNLLFAIRMRKWQEVNHWANLNSWKPQSDDSKEIPLFTDRVYTCSAITSPVFRGVIRPTLYFPENMTEEQSIRFFDSHHATHHKRKDILLKLAAVIISAVHWFNPFVWLLYYCFQEDCEISCAYKTACNMTETEKKDYRTLLSQYAEKQKNMCMTAAFGVGRQLQEKTLAVVIDRKNSTRVGAMALVICMLLGVVATTCYTYERELTEEETIIKYLEDPATNSYLAIDKLIDIEYVEYVEFLALQKESIINRSWPTVHSKEHSFTKFHIYTVAYKMKYKEGMEMYGSPWIIDENGVVTEEYILIYTKAGWRIHSHGFSGKNILKEE